MPTDAITRQEMAGLAQARSRVYSFLGGIFSRLPDERFVQSLYNSDLANLMTSLTQTEGLPEDMYEGVRLIEAFIRSVEKRQAEEVKTELAVERTRLLRGIKPGYSPPPPYESVYVGLDNQPNMQSSVAVRQAYAEAGVGLPEDLHDQPDFIGFELDFMRHLAEQESQAWDGGEEKALPLLDKEHAFLEQHILRWVPRFCDVMVEQAQLDFYRGVGRLTKGFVMDDFQNVGFLIQNHRAPQEQPQTGQ